MVEMLISKTKKKIVRGCFVVGNDRGLHTRPSTEIVKCASSFKSEIRLIDTKKNFANAKSILGVLMLAANRGAKITVEATGNDAKEAVASLLDLASQNFYIKY